MFMFIDVLVAFGAVLLVLILIAGAISVLTCYRKVEQGREIGRAHV